MSVSLDARNIRAIVRLYWADEERHYWESDRKGRRRHIFRILRALNKRHSCGMKENPDYKGWDPSEEEA